MDERKDIKVKVTKNREQWTAITYVPRFAFMGLAEDSRLVRADEAGVYIFLN